MWVSALKKLKKFGHAFPGLGGQLEDVHSRAHGLDVAPRDRFIEFHGGSEVRLGDNGNVRTVEYGWILQWFILALSYRDQHQTDIFSQIIRRRTNEIADVFNKEKIKLFARHACSYALHECSLEQDFFDSLQIFLRVHSHRVIMSLADVDWNPIFQKA